MSIASNAHPKAVAINVRERTRGWFNAVNLHWTGVALLALVNLYLLLHMAFAWQQAKSDNQAALDDQRIQLRAAELAARPLAGLDVKLASATTSADRFYMERLPVSYSEILTEIGSLKTRTGVRLTGANYTQVAAAGGAITDGTGGQLTEIHIDARLTGDYRALVLFINGLERDKVFFLINGIGLTGQQTGTVGLRLHVTTYLRGIVSQDELDKATIISPIADAERDAAAAAAPKPSLLGGAR